MSLIDDALKRAQAARDGAPRPGEDTRPWTPAPLPDRRRIARARALRIAGVTFAALAAAFAVVMLLRRPHRSALPAQRSQASTAVEASSAEAGLPPITSEVTVAPPLPGISSRPSSQAAPPFVPGHGEVPGRSRVIASAGSTRVDAAPARPEPVRPVAGTAERERKSRSSEEKTYAGEMPLPGGGKISLDGIVYSDSNPVAVLNGRVLPPGGYVEGFTVAKILPDRVELEADGRIILLTLR